jgi:alpha-amylase
MHRDGIPGQGFVLRAFQTQVTLFFWTAFLLICPLTGFGENVSAPAFLQIFESSWENTENRMVDVFRAGYGGLWLPPPARADSGGLSVGYDVFDRFDLGSPRNQTLYGTQTGLKSTVRAAHFAGVQVYTDYILNHNGFRDSSTPGFIAGGDYPGFVTTLANDVDGDFHGRFATGEEFFRLAGLIDIAQEKNHQFIRHPVAPSPLNIPSGSAFDQPNASNARFYPDRDQGGVQVFDPRLNQNVTLYNFNTASPLAGDAVAENATGLLMRNMRWMIQEIGVDGFRLDAARHFPRWMLDFADQAVFRASLRTHLDGSPQHVFSFSETGYDSYGFLQPFVRKDINPNNLSVVGGNRDALDFNLFGALRINLSGNGLVNDWRNIKNASLDVNDDGFANNGSQGVAFTQSHDEFGPYLSNVAHAYALMRPGNALVYMNAGQFGPPNIREFPKVGRGDALGGLYGDEITTLTNLRITHGRGNYADRTPTADQKEMLIYEREKSALVVLSNRLDGGFDSRTIQTSFQPGTPLLELTGNAADSVVDPLNDFASVVVVQPGGTVDIRVPRNRAPGVGGTEHGKGYFIFGVSGPQGTMRFLGSQGVPITQELAGGIPTSTTNGTTRLADIPVVRGSSFQVELQTQPVTLAGSIRDRHADGDDALLKIDGGLDLNGNGQVDHVQPGSFTYGFESFQTERQPGFFEPSGHGLYRQTIDTTQLSEGVHYVTGRAFRHRNVNTTTDNDPNMAGDGGPAVFTDFREAIYVDRLPPPMAVESFLPYGQPYQRDLMVQSLDATVNSVHLFLNLPATVNDATILNLVNSGNRAGKIDRDLFVYGYGDVKSGNHVATIVAYEPTGTWSITRSPGLGAQTGRGLGIGDLSFDNLLSTFDIELLPGSFEDVMNSQNVKFNPAADATADGLVDTRDLLVLRPFLVAGNATPQVLDAFERVVLRRGDMNMSGTADATDIDFLFDNLGQTSWRLDLDSDGISDSEDVTILVEQIFGTLFGDANLDGVVDGSDFGIWNSNKFTGDTGWSTGDFNGDGVTDGSDFGIWNLNKFQSGSGGARQLIPEPSLGFWGCLGLCYFVRRRRVTPFTPVFKGGLQVPGCDLLRPPVLLS